jgi:hypothetical protein
MALKDAKATAAVREAAAMSIPQGTIDSNKWWKHKNLRTLNFLLFFPLLSIFTLG